MSRTQLSLVGAFVIGGIGLFAVALFMIGDRRLLFDDQFEINADLRNVTGIQVGTRVRVGGFEAGEVLRIGLPASPSGRFVIGMRVRENLRPLIRTDSVAAVLSDGLLGNVFIQIREGTDAAMPVEDGATIRGIDAIEIADLISEGRETFRTLAQEFSELRQDFSRTINMLGDTVDTTTLLLNDVGNDVRAVSTMSALFMDSARAVAVDASELVADVRAGHGTLGKLLTDDTLYVHATNIARETEAIMTATRGAVQETELLVADLRAPDGASQRILSDISAVVGSARDAFSDLAENTEALKRNFLFSGFFNQRGFFNLDEMTLGEYRELTRSDDYETLRIWLQTDVLFEAAREDGQVALSDEGRRRIDSAMAGFLRYPRNSPLVVEGYALAGRRDQEYLAAQRRASAVRDYLVDVFGRATTVTGTMPVGADAAGSPRGDGSWDGVALTLFVRPEAVAAVQAGG